MTYVAFRDILMTDKVVEIRLNERFYSNSLGSNYIIFSGHEKTFVLGWTIGCSVEVKIHEYLEGTASQVKQVLIDLLIQPVQCS